jgi:hypothetical protein
MDDLYARNPGSVETQNAPPATVSNATTAPAAASTATAAPATSKDASSTGYTAQTGALSSGAMADAQLNKITAQDSPLMEQARQTGYLTAARRGLLNSSIAGGNAEAEAVKAATPLALQNSQLTAQNELVDKSATNQASQFTAGAQNTAGLQNAQLGTATNLQNASEADKVALNNSGLLTQASLTNATEANKANAQNAQLGTQASEFNSAQKQGTNNLNAAAENEMRTNVLNQNASFNKQYLAGSQSLDLATLQQQYGQLMAVNSSASSLYNLFFNNISQAMSSGLAPDRIAAMVDAQQTLLHNGLDLIDAINGMSGHTGAGNVYDPGQGNAVTLPPPSEALQPAGP